LKITITKRAGRVAQGEGPKCKPWRGRREEFEVSLSYISNNKESTADRQTDTHTHTRP
jgi:hypothetical protein